MGGGDDQYTATAPDQPLLCALYVGDLHPTVTEFDLVTTFSTCQGFASAFLCKNMFTGTTLCYGFINFFSSPQAMMAMKTLNYTKIKGQRIRVLLSNRDPTRREVGNVFVKNLEGSVDSLMLHNIFSTYGSVLSCKVALTYDGTSKGYGYVQFEFPDSADKAIREANGSFILSKQINVKRKILYVWVGSVKSLIIQRDSNGISRGFGFVCFENPVHAKEAMESLNGTRFASKTIYVAIAQKKAERLQLLRTQHEERKNKYKGLNVYIKNINNNVNEDILKDYFSQCGKINSVKIMRDAKGMHRGFGFVCFSTREEADNAIRKFHGVLFYGKPLYVAIAQSKEERATFLQTLRTSLCNPHAPVALMPGWRPPFTFQQPPHYPHVLHQVPSSATARHFVGKGRMNGAPMPILRGL
ncbi:hypothetical protein ACFE04_017453 [Oxalis oulophora]